MDALSNGLRVHSSDAALWYSEAGGLSLHGSIYNLRRWHQARSGLTVSP